MTRAAGFALLVIALASCGDEEIPDDIEPQEVYAGRCEAPRKGTDPTTGAAFVDEKGSMLTEKLWIRSWIDDSYLWYSEVPDVSNAELKGFPSVVHYFDVMKTTAVTPSGKPKDQFHFTYDTQEWVDLSQSGVEAGYGAQWVLLNRTPPRSLVVADVEPGSPADAAGITRGTTVQTIDGVDLANGNDVDTLNRGLFPDALGQAHTFTITDRGATTTRVVTLTSASITSVPVKNVRTLPAPYDKVGYMVFNDHIQTSEKGLSDGITQLRNAGVTDLVLDLRYNGGGYLVIAAQLAYMIAGSERSSGKIFEREKFNDKHDGVDDGLGFFTTTYFMNRGQPLPTLGLSRVFVLTGSGTCSASEAVMNGLAGVDVEVIQIGTTTCGKPYGFFPEDNCGTTFFAIQFQGVNNKGFGDYADGFAPGGLLHGCVVPDDFTHALGDPAERRLAAALSYRTNGTCPTARLGADADPLAAAEGEALKPLWRQNRIATPRPQR
jgi:carboxyl-terminal processing protease